MLEEKNISPEFTIRYFQQFPKEIQEIKKRAFSHSILTKKAQQLDDEGVKCGLFFNGEFKAGITLANQDTLKEWSKNAIKIDSEFNYLKRGFVADNIKTGFGSNLILTLMLYIIDSSNFYGSVKSETKSIRLLFDKLNFDFLEEFDSFHQLNAVVRLNLYNYNFNYDTISRERETLLTSITSINA